MTTLTNTPGDTTMTQAFKDYGAAYDSLPPAEWSSTFGNPGCGGFTEYWRTKDGHRYVISNGKWNAVAPFVWSVEQIQ